MGRWFNGDPPAWAAGEARPWPTQAEMRAGREQASGKGGQPAMAAGDVAPAPTPAGGGSRRKRRKRG